MKSLIAALQFLTILPLGNVKTDENDLAKSVFWFPVVGIIIGIIGSVPLYFLSQSFDCVNILSVVAVFYLCVISGGLHLDGLADSFDGLMSSRERKDKLEIMRDSRIGTMGVLAIFFCLSMKLFCLSYLTHLGFVFSVFLMPIAGRCSMLIVLFCFPYARKEGLALAFSKNQKKEYAVLPVCLFFLCGVLVSLKAALALTIVMSFFSFFWGRYTYKRLDGFTGDTLGACSEITEMLVPLTLVVLSFYQVI